MTSVEAQVRRMTDLAWAAGAIDAQGRFIVRPRTKGSHLLVPRVVFRCREAKRPIVERLRATLGGSCGRMDVSITFEWQVTGAKACLALDEELLPLLTAKARACQLHIELCRDMVEFKPASFEARSLPAEVVKRRRHLAHRINTLQRVMF